MSLPRPLAGVPRLDELLADPERALDLTPDAARALLIQMSQYTALRDVLLIAACAHGPARRDTGDRLLDKDAVAAKIGKSTSWMEKNPNDLPARHRVGGEALWSEREIEIWMKNRPK